MERELTAQERRFIDEYMVDLDVDRAALAAGYSESMASSKAYQWVSNSKNNPKPYIFEEIQKRTTALSEQCHLSKRWVLDKLENIAARCMQAAPVLNRKGEQVLTETPDGQLVPAFVFDSSGANRSVELVGKHLGMFKEAVAPPAVVNVNIDLEEAARRIAFLLAAGVQK